MILGGKTKMRNQRTIVIIGLVLVVVYFLTHLLFDRGTKRNHMKRSSTYSVNGTLG